MDHLRRSTRSNRYQGAMQERSVDHIWSSDDSDAPLPALPRAVEVFQAVAEHTDFGKQHITFCDGCGEAEDLIFCQGCSLAYHQQCLGQGASQGHTVTKLGEDDFVLQCKHCCGKDNDANRFAPHGGKCQDCMCFGKNCLPFGSEVRLRVDQALNDQNHGEDAMDIDPNLIDNASYVLFRCRGCYRAWHVDHVPPPWGEQDEHQRGDQQERLCSECIYLQGKVTMIAWRPRDDDAHEEPLSYSEMEEDQKDYLVKFENESYFRTIWVPGSWIWRKTTAMQRRAFARANQEAIMTTEAAIPREYLRAEVILDVEFHPDCDSDSIDNIAQVLIKFAGLPYEEACWELVPRDEQEDIHEAFEQAYEDWRNARWLEPPTASELGRRLRAVRALPYRQFPFQPYSIHGKLMDYQLAGLNWLYFQWYNKQNAILGDEMGLGKTLQVIAFLTALVDSHKCFPFLIVVPNSTCPNWRREFKKWAPHLKVVTYYGSKKARDMVKDYEMFPNNSTDLRCHVVISSFETVADEATPMVFRGVKWQGMVVDEGQRLKNDKSQLYAALSAMQVPFKVLLTGTPLQNNQRELFNLLQFLNPYHNAAELELQYQVLNSDKIAEIHELVRPYILRRTKQEVLRLPPLHQHVVPVSMSSLQKKVYKTILTKNAALMKTLLAAKSGEQIDRANHNNILMQLRKCLCHPFVYSKAIEERDPDPIEEHRNLVDASNKLKLLEIMLPRLQATGHRVLIFSQFLDALDIIEDFLTGLSMRYQRLDGSVNALEKQKRIDSFNAADSPYFAFLLSTRSGGVGINLASADTVIILDPDFNPHQDLQAISRAHRYGQTKPVLCFKLVTVGSAEERIMSMGSRKLALDQALIQELDEENQSPSDLTSVLQHGIKELFDDKEGQTIVYDRARVRLLLDRSNMTMDRSNMATGNAWSYAERSPPGQESELTQDAWNKIMVDRERKAARATARAAAQQIHRLGRGRRQRADIDYTGRAPFENIDGLDVMDIDMQIDQDDQDFHDNGDAESDEDRVVRGGRNAIQGKQAVLVAPGRITQTSLNKTLPTKKLGTSVSRKSTEVIPKKRGRPRKDASSATASTSKVKKPVITIED